MDTKLVEVLKQDVAKWEEAASAIDHWLPKLPEADRQQLKDRSTQYKANARAIRTLIEQLHQPAN